MKDNKRILVNHQIRAREVRVVKEDKQLGTMPLEEAIRMAKEENLDLVQVTDKVIPPVCKITDYGKYLYSQRKKDKSSKIKIGEIKGIRLTFGISDHDIETKAILAKKFLEKGDKIRIEMRLKGRQKGLVDFAKDKIKKYIQILEGLTSIKIERDIKLEPRGITLVISHQPKKNEAKN